MKKFFHVLLICILVTGCSIFTTDEKVTIKKQKRKKNQLFTYDSVSKDVSGIIQEGPGRYPEDDDQNSGTIPKDAIRDLKTLPPNMDAETAYNQLIYLFRRDYQFLEFRFANINPLVHVSEERKKAKPRKENLKVNIVIMVDSGPEMSKTIPGTKQTKMDRLKMQVKNSIKDLRRKIPKGISYYVMFKSYGGMVDKWTDLVPLDQAESRIFPSIDEVLVGKGYYDITFHLNFVKDQLKNETAGNVLNQIFFIHGSNSLQFYAIDRAKEIFKSDIQGQVHAVNYGVKDQKTKNRLQSIADGALGDYIIANPKDDIPFDFKDQTDFNDDGYNPREYQLVRIEPWTKRMADLKENQIAEIDTLYGKEYDQLMAATQYLKMKDTEKAKLIKEIEYRKKVLSLHYQQKLERLKTDFKNSKESLGIEE